MTEKDIATILDRYSGAGGAPAHGDTAERWAAVTSAAGRLGTAQVRDSARRRWLVEPWRDERRGRFVVVRPVSGDNEPFRASADGYGTETYLQISGAEWTLLGLLAYGHAGGDGRADEQLRRAAFVLVDRMVVEAQHRLLMGASGDDEDES